MEGFERPLPRGSISARLFVTDPGRARPAMEAGLAGFGRLPRPSTISEAV
jgi:hypothetical protein